NETDVGSTVAGVYSYNTIGTSNVTAGWSQTAEDALMLAVAVAEVESEPEPPEPPTGLDVTAESSSELSVDWDTEVGDLSYDVRFRSTDEFPSTTTQNSAPWHLERLSQRTRSQTNQYFYGYTGSGIPI